MILQADARSIPMIADKSVQCIVTSPPYFGLRDYGVTGQIGLEASLDEYLATMVAVAREWRRVLKDDGMVFCNMGDSYYSTNYSESRTKETVSDAVRGYTDAFTGRIRRNTGISHSRHVEGLKPKDLMGVPWRLAFALQADGWYLRSDIIWAKPNPMPESVTDRPTRSHEYIFLLSKRERYYYDADAIRESASAFNGFRGSRGSKSGANGDRNDGGRAQVVNDYAGRNKRDVWTINSEPTPEAHFATFPQKLVEPCVLAGTSEKGECVQCGANWVREVETAIEYDHFTCGTTKYQADKSAWVQSQNRYNNGHMPGYKHVITIGWRPTCSCKAGTRPNLVYDPFLGSGTVGLVAERLGRRWVGTELSAEYIAIAKKRTCQQGLFSHAAG